MLGKVAGAVVALAILGGAGYGLVLKFREEGPKGFARSMGKQAAWVALLFAAIFLLRWYQLR